VASLSDSGRIRGKPVLTCWLGARSARDGRQVLQEAGLPSYETPADVATAVSYLSQWSSAQASLMQVPANRSEDVAGDRNAVLEILRKAANEGRRMLTEPEAKSVISAYGVPVPETVVVDSPAAVEKAAGRLLKTSERIVVKLLSKSITHKSDVGGVALNLLTAKDAREAAETIGQRVRKLSKGTKIDGYAVQPMVAKLHGQELILGVSRDPVFGPVILFGAGGVAVEVMDDTAIGLPPLDDVLAGDLIDRTRIGRLLAGFRDRKPADRKAIALALNAVSQIVVDFPCIVSMDINPLLANHDGAIALDARIEIDQSDLDRAGPNPDILVRPYPVNWEKNIELKGGNYQLRPIKPADVSLYPNFLDKVSPSDLRLRFLSPRKSFSDKMLLRLTQLDYDRDMAFVGIDRETGQLSGISRVSSDPDHETAEYAILVRSDLQGRGLGWELLSHLIDYAAADGLKRIEGVVLSENSRMLQMAREIGFEVKHSDEPRLSVAILDLGQHRR
jgi:acetyltransferase